MDDVSPLSVPFLTRRMLSFEHAKDFQLSGEIRASSNRLVRISGFTREGPFTFSVQTGAGFTANTIAFRLPDIPLYIIVSDDSTAATQNSCYVVLNLSFEGTAYMHLCKGYLGPGQPLGWPDSPSPAPMQGKGEVAVITTADPAAGAEISLTVEAQSWLRLKSFQTSLVADATVSNRRPALRFTIGGTVALTIGSVASITASQTIAVTWLPVGEFFNDTSNSIQHNGLLPDILIPPDSVIATVTNNLQAGDNYAAGTLLVERFQAD